MGITDINKTGKARQRQMLVLAEGVTIPPTFVVNLGRHEDIIREAATGYEGHDFVDTDLVDTMLIRATSKDNYVRMIYMTTNCIKYSEQLRNDLHVGNLATHTILTLISTTFTKILELKRAGYSGYIGADGLRDRARG